MIVPRFPESKSELNVITREFERVKLTESFWGVDPGEGKPGAFLSSFIGGESFISEKLMGLSD